MGIRGELFSNKVSLPNRTYFFNVKENRMGDLYLNIVESKNRDNGGFDRQSVILFADDLQEFLKGFDESLRVMEKAMREKRQSGAASRGRAGREKSEPDSRENNNEREARSPRHGDDHRGHGGEQRRERTERGMQRSSPRREHGGENRRERTERGGGNRNDREGQGRRSSGNRSERDERSSGERRSERSTRSPHSGERSGGRSGEQHRQKSRGTSNGRDRGRRDSGSTERSFEKKPGKRLVVKKKD